MIFFCILMLFNDTLLLLIIFWLAAYKYHTNNNLFLDLGTNSIDCRYCLTGEVWILLAIEFVDTFDSIPTNTQPYRPRPLLGGNKPEIPLTAVKCFWIIIVRHVYMKMSLNSCLFYRHIDIEPLPTSSYCHQHNLSICTTDSECWRSVSASNISVKVSVCPLHFSVQPFPVSLLTVCVRPRP